MSLLLSAILADHPMAHAILIDPHNEYGRVFGRTAEVINIDNLQLPFWLFDFEEAVGILVRGGTVQEQEAQTLILKDAITRARRQYAGESHAATTLSVDTPTPFSGYPISFVSSPRRWVGSISRTLLSLICA